MRIEKYLFILVLALSLSSSSAREIALKRPPSEMTIARFEVARQGKVNQWHTLPKSDGNFILAEVGKLPHSRPYEGEMQMGCTLPPANYFSMRVIAKGGGHYYLTFTSGKSVWVGNNLLSISDPTANLIAQKAEQALKKKP